MLRVVVSCSAVLALTACAGRAPQLTPIVQASDGGAPCDKLRAETKVNEERIAGLETEKQWKMGQNVVAGIAGFMFWPAWLGLDAQNAAGQESSALSQRNRYLTTLAREKCGVVEAASTRTPALEGTMSTLATSAELAPDLIPH
jgi:hypothetical protein